METAGILVAALVTVMVLSHIFGDNPLVRIAEHIFIGVSVGYITVITLFDVLYPRLLLPLANAPEQNLGLYALLVVALLLITRLPFEVFKPLSWLANIPLALAAGVGAGLVLLGAIRGSIVTQIGATAETGLNLGGIPTNFGVFLGSLVVVIGTIAVITQFYFTIQRNRPGGAAVRVFEGISRPILMIGFGALFASLAASAFAQLAERVSFLVGFLTGT